MQKHILYYHPYSICSLQVRYTIAIASTGVEGQTSPLLVENRLVDVFNSAQLSEEFLTQVNPKGQVPTLISPTLQAPIADSLLITYYLMDAWPQLAPQPHKAHIKTLLQEIHALNYFALSFPDRPQVAESLVRTVEAELEKSDLTAKHRAALKYKLELTVEEKLSGIKPESVLSNEEEARKLFVKLEALLQGTPWLFGLTRPTALDAHTVILVGRLQDVGRTSLVPDRLLKYADAAFDTPELQDVVGGNRTMISSK